MMIRKFSLIRKISFSVSLEEDMKNLFEIKHLKVQKQAPLITAYKTY